MAYESPFQRIFPLVTAVAAASVVGMVAAFFVLERERAVTMPEREIVEASLSLSASARRLEDMLELAEEQKNLSEENSRLREQIEFLREKNEFLEILVETAREQGFELGPDNR